MSRYRIFIFVAATLSATLWAYACGDGATEPPTPPPDPPRPAAVTQLTALGATAQLSAQVRDQNGQVMAGAAVAWSSSATSIATASGSGLVTAAGNGTATITATAGAVSGSATVSVAQMVSSTSVSAAGDTLVEGDTVHLSAEAVDSNGHAVDGAEFEWASSDTLVATVDDSGLVTGVAAGEAEITATSSGATGRAQVIVVAPVPTTVAVTPDSVVFTAIGQTEQLSAEVRDQIGRPMVGVAASWSSSDTTIAAVDSAGLVTAAGIGVATVAATVGEVSGAAFVTVEQSAGSVIVSPRADTIAPGDPLRLLAEAYDENGHPVESAQFSWSSSDVSVARVDGSGVVTGVAEGTATITAMAGQARGTAEITVENPDRAALLAPYEATDGPNWVDNENWLTDAPLGDWYGVVTDGQGRVVSLELYENGLTGTIPAELGNLANLERLWIFTNNLSGPIPSELGSLLNLKYLTLNTNNLSGPIPPELGSLPHLVSMSLGANYLTGPIPPELGRLQNVERLHLGSNRLSGSIPPELGEMHRLRVLGLAFNHLEGAIPSELGDLRFAEDLQLQGNKLTGSVPQSFLSLDRLTRFWINDNYGLCVPSTGGFKEWFTNISARSGLYCDELDITALTALYSATNGPGWRNSGGWLAEHDLDDWYGVRTNAEGRVAGLDLENNGLVGVLPPELSGLTGISELGLANNRLRGPIPEDIGALASLRRLDLTNNQDMFGALPETITRIDGLRDLLLGGTGVCVPEGEPFLSWLDGIANRRVDSCVKPQPTAYLVQAVQSPEFAVPLVAGEKALLRVFVSAGRATDASIPSVRASLYLGGDEVYTVDIPGRQATIPAEVDEGDLAKSANWEIPGWVIQPGLEMVIAIDPDSTVAPELGVTKRIPDTGRMSVQVREMPAFGITVVPFIWSNSPDSSIVKELDGISPDDDLFWPTRTLLPVGEFDVEVHDPVWTSTNKTLELLAVTDSIRVSEDPDRYYVGAMSIDSFEGDVGWAHLGGKSVFSQLRPNTIAHELGHAMNLLHALEDPDYPHPDQSIGVWGYDFRNGGTLVSPDAGDLMGGGRRPTWISDYHFTKAALYQLTREAVSSRSNRTLVIVR